MITYCIALIAFWNTLDSPLHENEAGILGTPVLLTDPLQFVKAGESYFDKHTKRIIFQAIEHPDEGQEVSTDYSMYIGTLSFDDAGAISGLEQVRRISNQGSANTCGWFHPTDDGTVLFSTTTSAKIADETPGYQRESGTYQWAFPPSMNIVACDLENNDKATSLVANDDHYIAEGSWSPDGRHILFCSLATGDGDVYVKDQTTGVTTLLVGNTGYDGGPFFSPDGTRIAYRSDRRGNDLLQLFVSELDFNEDGSIVGVKREFQLTDNAHVNWGPFWHPNGRFLIYATSEVGHHNYELYLVDAISESGSATKYGTRKRRITHAPGFDGLPVFNATGNILMWTSKRVTNTSQIWAAPFLFDLEAAPNEKSE